MADNDSTYVRVKDREGAGAHYTIPRDIYDAFPDDYTLLKSPAVDHNGVPTRPKYPADLSAETKSGSAADSKEK